METVKKVHPQRTNIHVTTIYIYIVYIQQFSDFPLTDYSHVTLINFCTHGCTQSASIHRQDAQHS